MAGKIYPIRGSTTRFAVQMTNAAAFGDALRLLDIKMSRVIARMAVKEAADVLAKAWAENAKAMNTTGRGEGHYGESIRVTTRSSTLADGSGGRALRGASAVISPTARVGGVPDDEQPHRYAAVNEFGGTLGDAQHRSHIPARPVARPAFENNVDRAVDATETFMRRMLP